MNRKIFTGIFIITVAMCCNQTVVAQTDSVVEKPTYKIGIFAPLFLDSVFSNNTFRYSQGMPHFIMPGVDFIQGAQVALDSLHLTNANIDAYFFDSKAYVQNIPWLIANKKLDSLDLIIGSVKETEFKQLAELALLKKIPFISTTYPNDGGITANPYVVIVNATLRSHCNAIYSYILQNHGTDKIFLCRKAGTQEDMIAGVFKQLNEQDGKPLLNIETINFSDNITADLLKAKLDSNRQNIIIGASLDESFATAITSASNKIQNTYPITLIGMPNWDGIAGLHKKEIAGDLPVYFTTPYFNNKWNDYSKMLISAYLKGYKMRPGDMAFKGFEMVNIFTRLLLKYPGHVMENINDRPMKIFCEYNFNPVHLNKESTIPDYYENKHLYFIKILNGVATKAW